MSSRISRRGVFGIGAGLSVAFVDGQTPAAAQPAGAPPPTFTLLLVNDIYKMSESKGRGGFPRLAAIVKAERARGLPMLFCHAGDTFSPSLMSGFDQGEHIVALTNLIEPDVFVPGNHEFDFGKEAYFKRMAEARFPFFGANMTLADGSPVPGMKGTEIYTFGGVKIGLVGLVMEEVPQVSHSGDLRFEPVMATLRREVEALRAKGADILVAVTHTDRAVDNQIVRSRLVDILLTGHDHDLAITYDGKTVMVESNEEGNFVTAIDVTARVSGEGLARTVAWSPNFRVHDSATVTPDPDMTRVVAAYEGELSKVLDVVLGTTEVALDSRTSVVRSEEAALGNLVTDAMREAAGADVTVMNAGSIRANEIYPAGAQLRRRDILSELPFGNTTVLVEMTGADLVATLEHGFSAVGEPSGRFPQVSGLKVTYSGRAPVGRRVRSVTIGGQEIDLDRRYRVAANNYMLGGGDGYAMLARGKVLVGATDGKLVANEVMSYVRSRGRVRPAVEGRIVALD
ncbi:bifunctional UDP-sugar hydrolase/5'-nucleotidase [Enterovirga sp.]|jgi:5'-nucleotidase/UDP-sugar diphosphatase|uniref:bifunctional metallophosphatase/5'-nucleotidase n=1 Tax=Enterovirga sp. TaxID=2026350 RepID=UPI002633A312|nr:bifunctional UDP-sugar hydrolase/5'-nucleotidase [Enterovirga sp.]MDB5590162.1 5-nucleotidase [Enterovirga sp.]